MPFGPLVSSDEHDAQQSCGCHHAPAPAHGSLRTRPINEPHRHAFVLVGDKTLFIVHMTQHWYEEHRYQFILEVMLPPEETARYQADRKNHPEQSYFLANLPRDVFTLPSLQAGERREFRCEIFRGIPAASGSRYTAWPWDENFPRFIQEVVVTARRTVHYRPFSDRMHHPTTLTYLLFGVGDEAHMTNWQTKEPDFDHVVSLQAAPSWLPPDQLKAGVIVDIPGQETSTALWPLARCKNPWPNEVDQYVRYRGEEDERLIKIGKTAWFSLKIVNSANPCPDGGEQVPAGS